MLSRFLELFDAMVGLVVSVGGESAGIVGRVHVFCVALCACNGERGRRRVGNKIHRACFFRRLLAYMRAPMTKAINKREPSKDIIMAVAVDGGAGNGVRRVRQLK